jgi:hypothetical protein
MINVIEQIKPLLKFDSTDDFYFLQILKRKKDNPEIKSNGITIKNYYIKSIKQLEEKYPEIISLCCLFNARASLRLNKRSYKNVAIKTVQLICNNMINGDWNFAHRAFDRACGKGHNDKNKKWIIDIDDNPVNADKLDNIISDIYIARPEGNKIYCQLPTKSGIHLITRPFDLRGFKDKWSLDIHKDNPINLYIN